MYGLRGYFQLETTSNLLFYNIDTTNGQSGSAIIVELSGGRQAIIGNRLTIYKIKLVNSNMRVLFNQ